MEERAVDAASLGIIAPILVGLRKSNGVPATGRKAWLKADQGVLSNGGVPDLVTRWVEKQFEAGRQRRAADEIEERLSQMAARFRSFPYRRSRAS